VFADYEGGLVGVQSSNVGLETSNFTYNLCVGMLFFDAVLYGVLAWYLDNVLPSEFGTPLPYYFPFLPSYWVGGSESRGGDKGVWSGVLEWCGYPQRRYSAVSDREEDGVENALHSGLLDSQHGEGGGGGDGGDVVVRGQQKGEFIEPVSDAWLCLLLCLCVFVSLFLIAPDAKPLMNQSHVFEILPLYPLRRCPRSCCSSHRRAPACRCARCARSSRARRAAATAWPSTSWTWSSIRARSPCCSDTTAPARPPPSVSVCMLCGVL